MCHKILVMEGRMFSMLTAMLILLMSVFLDFWLFALFLFGGVFLSYPIFYYSSTLSYQNYFPFKIKICKMFLFSYILKELTFKLNGMNFKLDKNNNWIFLAISFISVLVKIFMVFIFEAMTL